MNITFGDPDRNFLHAEQLIAKAAAQEPDVIVMPELWTTGYDLLRLPEIADKDGARTRAFISEQAQKFGIHFIAGSYALQTSSGVTNTMLFVHRNGDIIGEYSKLHLFQLMDEHLHLKAGQEKGLFQLDHIPCAGVICYDIRFPEWILAHTLHGSQVLFVCAEWPIARLDHWRTLLVSRAIENQCYVVACNRSGADPSHVYAGHSMIIDPWGFVLSEAGEEETNIMATLDLDRVREIRNLIPVLADRKPQFYR